MTIRKASPAQVRATGSGTIIRCRGQFAEARRNLVPIAFDPHASGAGRVAQALVARLDAEGKPPTHEEMMAISRQAAAEGAAEEPADGETDGTD